MSIHSLLLLPWMSIHLRFLLPSHSLMYYSPLQSNTCILTLFMCVIEHNVLITLLHFPIGLLVSSSNFSSMEAMCIKQDIRLWLVLNHYLPLPRCGFPIAPLWVSNCPVVGFQLPHCGFPIARCGFPITPCGFPITPCGFPVSHCGSLFMSQ